MLALYRFKIFSIVPERLALPHGRLVTKLVDFPRQRIVKRVTLTVTPRLAERRVFLRASCGSFSHQASKFPQSTAA